LDDKSHPKSIPTSYKSRRMLPESTFYKKQEQGGGCKKRSEIDENGDSRPGVWHDL
jgi:hypothetical protein